MLTIAELQQRTDEILTRYNVEAVTVVPLTQSGKSFKLGTASYWTRQLAISFTSPRGERSDDELMETIYHECAHFIAFTRGDYKHGRTWKSMAKTLGAYGRARIGTLAAEQAKDKHISESKTQRARNRKAHPSHTEYHSDCHLCRRDFANGRDF